jgi:hypothetical protein
MNRFTSAVPVALVLAAASLATYAADEAPSAAATPVATTAAAASSTASPSASPAGKTTQASSNTPGNSSMHRLVCLNMSLQCFAVKPKTDDAAARTRTASLDLKAPDVRRVAPATLYAASTDEPVEIEEQQVQVEGTRPEVYVPGGLASLPWAVMHPAQAWRIFMPVPPGAAK